MMSANGTTLPVLRGRLPAELAKAGRALPITVQRRLPAQRKQPNRHVMRLTVVLRAAAAARSRRPVAVRAAPQYPAVIPASPAPKPLKAPRPKKRGSGLLKKAQAFMRYMAD